MRFTRGYIKTNPYSIPHQYVPLNVIFKKHTSIFYPLNLRIVNAIPH